MQINQPKCIKPKMTCCKLRSGVKLVRDIKAERYKTNGPKTRPLCASILNACDTNYFVVAHMDQNAVDRHYAI